MITKMIQIPVTEENYPFQSAAKKCNFDAIGYIEDEYFMSGTANIYTEKDKNHQVEPIFEGAPYTTRLLVRRPADPAKFSGDGSFFAKEIEYLRQHGYKFVKEGDLWHAVQ